jgi:hypothetical protein
MFTQQRRKPPAANLGAKKKDLQLALQVLAFLVGPPGVEPGTNGL